MPDKMVSGGAILIKQRVRHRHYLPWFVRNSTFRRPNKSIVITRFFSKSECKIPHAFVFQETMKQDNSGSFSGIE
jgi:hypothetical protein